MEVAEGIYLKSSPTPLKIGDIVADETSWVEFLFPYRGIIPRDRTTSCICLSRLFRSRYSYYVSRRRSARLIVNALKDYRVATGERKGLALSGETSPKARVN